MRAGDEKLAFNKINSGLMPCVLHTGDQDAAIIVHRLRIYCSSLVSLQKYKD